MRRTASRRDDTCSRGRGMNTPTMHPWTFVPIVCVLSTFASAFTVRAADLPVSYLVDETALKAAVAGTALTFELHTDLTCTSPVVARGVPI